MRLSALRPDEGSSGTAHSMAPPSVSSVLLPHVDIIVTVVGQEHIVVITSTYVVCKYMIHRTYMIERAYVMCK